MNTGFAYTLSTFCWAFGSCEWHRRSGRVDPCQDKGAHVRSNSVCHQLWELGQVTRSLWLHVSSSVATKVLITFTVEKHLLVHVELSQILGSQVEHASPALLATTPLGYKQGRVPQATELETLLQAALTQTFVLHNQAPSPFLAHITLRLTKECKWYRWTDSSPHLYRGPVSFPSSPWIHSLPGQKQVCRMHACGPAPHSAIIHVSSIYLSQHTVIDHS